MNRDGSSAEREVRFAERGGAMGGGKHNSIFTYTTMYAGLDVVKEIAVCRLISEVI